VKRRSTPQFELGFSNEPFALVASTAQDGARIAREEEKRTQDRAEASARQLEIAPKHSTQDRPPLVLTGLHPFRLHEGDLVQYEGKACHVVRVSESAAVLAMTKPAVQRETRFGKTFTIQPPPVLVRISPNSEVPILSRGGAI
jgi:hypothetical protein